MYYALQHRRKRAQKKAPKFVEAALVQRDVSGLGLGP